MSFSVENQITNQIVNQPVNYFVTVVETDLTQQDSFKKIETVYPEEKAMKTALAILFRNQKFTVYINRSPEYQNYYFKVGSEYFEQICYVNQDFIEKFEKEIKKLSFKIAWNKVYTRVNSSEIKNLAIKEIQSLNSKNENDIIVYKLSGYCLKLKSNSMDKSSEDMPSELVKDDFSKENL